jgi:hypothetical protein
MMPLGLPYISYLYVSLSSSAVIAKKKPEVDKHLERIHT